MVVVETSDSESDTVAVGRPDKKRKEPESPLRDESDFFDDEWEALGTWGAESDGSMDVSDMEAANRERRHAETKRLESRKRWRESKTLTNPEPIAFADEPYRCHICIGPLDFPVVARCGHAFCYECWEDRCKVLRTKRGQKIECPVCSVQINADGGRLNACFPLVQALDELGIQCTSETERARVLGHDALVARDEKSVYAAAATRFRTGGRQYSIILADPPWQYNNTGCRGNCSAHYETMDDVAIGELPVRGLARDDCVLLLWATGPKMWSALRVMEAWGFRYVTTGFTWIKINRRTGEPVFNPGWWTASCAEYVLIGVRGNARVLKRVDMMSSIIRTFRDPTKKTHSRKPKAFFKRLDTLFEDVPRIELFARSAYSGWDVWGNQAPAEPHTPQETKHRRKQDHRAIRLETHAREKKRRPISQPKPNTMKRANHVENHRNFKRNRRH